MTTRRERALENLEALFAAVVTYLWLVRWREFALFVIFQTRDLDRAEALAHGHLIFFGPELTGGGHLPGPFYYVLLALPLRLGLGWQGCWCLMNVLGALGVGLAWRFVRRRFGLEAAALVALQLITAPLFFKAFGYFDNPSFTPFFLLVICLGLARAFGEGERRGWLWAAPSIGLAMQIHMTAVVFVVAALVLQLAATRLRVARLAWRDFGLGAALFALTLVPYALWLVCRRFGLELGQAAPDLQSLEPSALEQVGHGMLRVGTWSEILQSMVHAKLVRLLSLPFVVFSVALALTSKRWRAQVELAEGSRRIARVWGVCLALLTFPALIGAYQPTRPRYGIPFALCSSLAIGAWAATRLDVRWKRAWAGFLLLVQALIVLDPLWSANDRLTLRVTPFIRLPLSEMIELTIVIATTYALSFGRFRRAAVLISFALLPLLNMKALSGYTGRPGLGLTTPEFEAMSRAVIDATGWTWEEARERLFYVKVHHHRSPVWIYRGLEKTVPTHLLDPKPDGFFVAADFRKGYKIRDDVSTWLRHAGLPHYLDYGLKNELLRLGPPLLIGRGSLIPYYVDDKMKFPEKFQNFGAPYVRDQTRIASASAQEIQRVAADRVEARFNDCPDLTAFCEIQFDVRRERKAGGRAVLTVRLTGDVLSQSSAAVFPDWSQNLISPFISRRCAEGEKPHRLEIVPSIGYSERAGVTRTVSDQFLAPFERRFLDPCGNKSSAKITIGYRQSVARDKYQREELPGRKLFEEAF